VGAGDWIATGSVLAAVISAVFAAWQAQIAKGAAITSEKQRIIAVDQTSSARSSAESSRKSADASITQAAISNRFMTWSSCSRRSSRTTQ